MQNQELSTTEELTFMGAPTIRPEQHDITSSRPYIVKKLLLEAQVSILAGPPNTGKSSIAAMLAAKVALGENINQFRTKQAAVIYNAVEDHLGIIERAHGHLDKRPDHFPGLLVTHRPMDLRSQQEMDKAIADVLNIKKRTGADRVMVVIDTLNLSVGDGDENSSRDMSQVVGNLQRLARQTRAHVMIIHHTSAADPLKPRGSTALPSNVDTVLVLGPVKDCGERTLAVLTQGKQRSVQKGAPVHFEIEALEVGFDEDGDLITVPKAELVPEPFEGNALIDPKTGKMSLSERRAQAALNALEILDDESEGSYHSPATVSARVGEDFAKGKLKPDSLRKKVKEALDLLVSQGEAETNGREYRILSGLFEDEAGDEVCTVLH